MFPEYRDLISRLKNENPRFMSLFDKHNKLDHEIARKEGSDGRGYNAEVVRMKKQKLQLKDEIAQNPAAGERQRGVNFPKPPARRLF